MKRPVGRPPGIHTKKKAWPPLPKAKWTPAHSIELTGLRNHRAKQAAKVAAGLCQFIKCPREGELLKGGKRSVLCVEHNRVWREKRWFKST